jgi:hypothetical protein
MQFNGVEGHALGAPVEPDKGDAAPAAATPAGAADGLGFGPAALPGPGRDRRDRLEAVGQPAQDDRGPAA